MYKYMRNFRQDLGRFSPQKRVVRGMERGKGGRGVAKIMSFTVAERRA